NLLIWVLLGGAIIGSTLVSDLLRNQMGLDVLRFTFPAAPAAYALAAAAFTDAGMFRLANERSPARWAGHAVVAAIFFGCLCALPQTYEQPWKADLRQLTGLLDRDAGPNDLLIIPYSSKPEHWESSLTISAITHYSQFPHRPSLALSGPISP